MKYYKYAHWSGKNGDYTRDALSNNYVYASSPRDFNDPFDFNPVYDHDATEKEKTQHLARLYKKNQGMSKTVATRKAKEQLREHEFFHTQDGLEKFALDSKESLRRVVGVSCFTINPNNSPMWAHYADNHQGVCLEWEIPDMGEHFFLPSGVNKIIPLVLAPVEYASERAVIRMFFESRLQGDALVKSILTKSIDWKYEREYRLVIPNHVGRVYYEPFRLSGIILGYKMSSEDVEGVKLFVKKMKFQPRIYKAHLSERGFDYDIKLLK